MEFFEVSTQDQVTTVTMARGKVNAINARFVAEFSELLEKLGRDPDTHAVVLTGRGKFFSFGFDIPELYDSSPEAMTTFVQRFCNLYYDLFLFPKPLIGALNGHAVAGGCILALACDHRVMNDSAGKVSLNEVTFGASLFAGVVEMLRYAAGNRTAEAVLLTGKMYSPQEAMAAGLVDQLAPETELLASAASVARELSQYVGPNFTSLKRLARGPIADEWRRREGQSIREWIDIWYSPETREKAKSIQIR